MVAMMLATLLAAGQPNPLIGTWTAERTTNARFDVASPPTMTITRDAILFEQNGQITGHAAITGFDHDGPYVSANTREGEPYLFHFTTVNRMCRKNPVNADDHMMPQGRSLPERCWDRTPPMKQATRGARRGW